MLKLKNIIYHLVFLLKPLKINVLISRNVTEFKFAKNARVFKKKRMVRFETFHFLTKWFFSTNHFIIGVLYILLGFIGGLLGTVASILIRLELLHM